MDDTDDELEFPAFPSDMDKPKDTDIQIPSTSKDSYNYSQIPSTSHKDCSDSQTPSASRYKYVLSYICLHSVALPTVHACHFSGAFINLIYVSDSDEDEIRKSPTPPPMSPLTPIDE